MTRCTAQAYARAGLLGNPSDLYQGKVIAFTLADFRAEALVEAHPLTSIDPAGGLCAAAVKVFRRLLPAEQQDPQGWRLRLTFQTDVPRQAGLSGSSAIILAALRALALWFELELAPMHLAQLALEAERDHLGITAGPQDRVIQAHNGLLWMDFSHADGLPRIEALDPDTLPPLFIAWDPQPGAASGPLHAGVRERWLAGDPQVVAGIAELPRLAEEGREALRGGDHLRLRQLVERNFDLRAEFFPITPRDRRMIDLGRALGAATKFCGSGGAVLGVPAQTEDLAALQRSYLGAGFEFLQPRIQI